MKKLISVLLCFALLFSFGALAVAEEAPKLTVKACKDNTAWTGALIAEDYVCFNMSVKNCPDFESFELLITYNPKVLEYSAVYPFEQTEIVKNSIDCTVIEPGKLKVIGSPASHGVCDDFDPFCMEIIGNGETDISVELVLFSTTDGEVENVVFDADIQNFNTSDYFVRYDLDGDCKITAADARMALRFSVGLLTATDEQCRAVGVIDTSGFTAETARFILRAAVGLEGDAEKVVTNVEWSTNGEIGFIVYHYSDGTYGSSAELKNRPDWI